MQRLTSEQVRNWASVGIPLVVQLVAVIMYFSGLNTKFEVLSAQLKTVEAVVGEVKAMQATQASQQAMLATLRTEVDSLRRDLTRMEQYQQQQRKGR